MTNLLEVKKATAKVEALLRLFGKAVSTRRAGTLEQHDKTPRKDVLEALNTPEDEVTEG